LVHSLGGSLKVESSVGEGSLFHFTLDIPTKQIERKGNANTMKIAIYTPIDVQLKDSNHYLESYLRSFEPLSIIRFNTIDACMNAPFSLFDTLYIHYDKMNSLELEKIVAHHGSDSNIILVTKLNKRHLVQEVLADFTQVLYEPLTFSKIEKSFNALLEKQKSTPKILRQQRMETRVKEKKTMELFSNIHALVVEDNPINQKMIQHTLKNIGITSECADNGKIGVEMYMKSHNKFDVVFMDIQMPIMNGIEATKAILAYEQRKNLDHKPIIAVTANALKGDRENFMAEGIDEYVSKPIDLEKFIAVLKMFFKESQDAAPLPTVLKTDILLYKETAMEAKIISAILHKLDYSVDVVKNIDELKKVMDVNSYKCILLDRVHSEVEHSNVSQHIKAKKIPSLLFVDSNTIVVPSDKESFTFVLDKVTDYQSIKSKVDHMISLVKAS